MQQTVAKPRVRVRAPGVRTAMSSAVAFPEVETAYHAASISAKDMMTWYAPRMSPDAALLNELDTIVGRADDLKRNNGVAAGLRRTLVDNIIGPRLIWKPNPDRIALGRDAKWAREWSREVESQWATFAETVWFDAAQKLNFHSMTRLAYLSIVDAGEALALPLWLPDRGSMWTTCLQMVDPGRLSTPTWASANRRIRAGVEVDEFGAPVAYHMRKTHPFEYGGSLGLAIAGLGDWERVPAYTPWGRLRVLHAFDQDEVGKTRGVPAFTSVVRQFKMLDHKMREELRLSVLHSMIFGAIETPLDQETIVELFKGEKPFEAYEESIKQWRVPMQGGALIPMPPGTQMKPFLPQRSTSDLKEFAQVMLRYVGAGVNLPYELAFRDFSQTNYSSARAALVEAWRFFLSGRQMTVDTWAAPCTELWFEEAVNRRRIPDCTPAEFYANRIAWTRGRWIATGRGWIDAFKEARAAELRLKTGVSTLADECGEQGYDWRDQMEQRAAENALADELDLPRPHSESAGAKPSDPVNIAEDAADDTADDRQQEGAAAA